jgi:hypothetical protein
MNTTFRHGHLPHGAVPDPPWQVEPHRPPALDDASAVALEAGRKPITPASAAGWADREGRHMEGQGTADLGLDRREHHFNVGVALPSALRYVAFGEVPRRPIEKVFLDRRMARAEAAAEGYWLDDERRRFRWALARARTALASRPRWWAASGVRGCKHLGSVDLKVPGRLPRCRGIGMSRVGQPDRGEPV